MDKLDQSGLLNSSSNLIISEYLENVQYVQCLADFKGKRRLSTKLSEIGLFSNYFIHILIKNIVFPRDTSSQSYLHALGSKLMKGSKIMYGAKRINRVFHARTYRLFVLKLGAS